MSAPVLRPQCLLPAQWPKLRTGQQLTSELPTHIGDGIISMDEKYQSLWVENSWLLTDIKKRRKSNGLFSCMRIRGNSNFPPKHKTNRERMRRTRAFLAALVSGKCMHMRWAACNSHAAAAASSHSHDIFSHLFAHLCADYCYLFEFSVWSLVIHIIDLLVLWSIKILELFQ